MVNRAYRNGAVGGLNAPEYNDQKQIKLFTFIVPTCVCDYYRQYIDIIYFWTVKIDVCHLLYELFNPGFAIIHTCCVLPCRTKVTRFLPNWHSCQKVQGVEMKDLLGTPCWSTHKTKRCVRKVFRHVCTISPRKPIPAKQWLEASLEKKALILSFEQSTTTLERWNLDINTQGLLLLTPLLPWYQSALVQLHKWKHCC